MKYTKLCEVAQQGATELDWTTTKNAFRGVFRTLPTVEVGRLAVSYIRLYLPRFIEKNPEETWVDERLLPVMQILNGELAPDQLPG